MATIGCGISHKSKNIQINAATAKKQHRNKMEESQTNIFLKYSEDNTQKV
jgi:hypothetical protein